MEKEGDKREEEVNMVTGKKDGMRIRSRERKRL